MKRIVWLGGAAVLAGVLTMGLRGQSSGPFRYVSFVVPEAVNLHVESINNKGSIAGYFSDTAGNSKGFVRSSARVVTPFVDPADERPVKHTEAYQINDLGVVAGLTFDSRENSRSGFLFYSGTKAMTSFRVPGQPVGTATASSGVDATASQFCGYFTPPSHDTATAFISINGRVETFSVNNSSWTVCSGMNQHEHAVGYFKDASGVSHGFTRNPQGVITIIDFPSASLVSGNFLCGGTGGGTQIVAITDRDELAGHFWDKSNREHAFSRTPGGIFQQVDFPGAVITGGGGMNSQGTVVGSYYDSSCHSTGYLAYRNPEK